MLEEDSVSAANMVSNSTLRFAICVVGAIALMLFVNTRLFAGGSLWCDNRIKEAVSEKDRSVKKALDQLRKSLSEQEQSVAQLRAERATSQELRDKLAKLKSQRKPRHGGSEAEQQQQQLQQQPQPQPQPQQQHGGVTSDVRSAAITSAATHGGAHSAAHEPRLGGHALPLLPSAIAVVVIAYNRPEYLDKALTSIFRTHPGGSAFPVYVSQDGPNNAVTAVAKRHGAQSLVHPRKPLELPRGSYIAKMQGYAYLSVHYGWALRTLFGLGSGGEGGQGPYAGVIILEEDIEISADFFSYFNATARLLDQDESLLCVSAYNDNGQGQYAGDPRAVHRSDFFPGLGGLEGEPSLCGRLA